jgi:hypothetical protein
MKKLMVIMLITIFTGAEFSLGQTCDIMKDTFMKEIVKPIEKIIVNAAVNVVLLQDEEPSEPVVEGDENLMQEIITKQDGNTLTISAAKNVSYRGKVLVTVPVKQLRELVVNSNSEVASLNVLLSPSLAVLIAADCRIRLKSLGKIYFDGADAYNYRYVYRNENQKGHLQERKSL